MQNPLLSIIKSKTQIYFFSDIYPEFQQSGWFLINMWYLEQILKFISRILNRCWLNNRKLTVWYLVFLLLAIDMYTYACYTHECSTLSQSSRAVFSNCIDCFQKIVIMLSIWTRHDVIMLLNLSLKFVVFYHNGRWIRGLKPLCWSVKKSILVALLSHKKFSWDKISNLRTFIVYALNRQELVMSLFLQRLQAAHHLLLTKSICNQHNSRLKFFIKGTEMLHELTSNFFPLAIKYFEFYR